MELFGRGVPGQIQPGFAVKADRIHHQFITFPLADGVSEPCRLGIFRMRGAVEEDLAIAMHTALEEYDHHIGLLQYFGRIRIAPRHTGRQGARLGFVVSLFRLAFFEQLLAQSGVMGTAPTS